MAEVWSMVQATVVSIIHGSTIDLIDSERSMVYSTLLVSQATPPQSQFRGVACETIYRIAGIFRGGGKIFVVFVVEKQTTKYLPTKQLP